MEITISNVRPATHRSIKGNFDVSFSDIQLTIKECRLISGSSGFFIGFPSQKQDDGQYKNLIFMNDKNPYYEEILSKAMDQIINQQRGA
jgi:DNA-binding cell septation regulator SpoVG